MLFNPLSVNADPSSMEVYGQNWTRLGSNSVIDWPNPFRC